MRVLGLETTGDTAGLALVEAAGLRAELTFRHEMQLSRLLAGRIRDLLDLAGLSAKDVEGVAVSRGPGSFTSVRIGVTLAKSFAYALGVPAVGVSTLEALASEHPAPPRSLVCSLLSASATEVFAALYQWEGETLAPRAEELLLPAADLAQRLSRSPLDVMVVGQPGTHRELFREALGPRGVFLPEPQVLRAATVARLGRARLVQGAGGPAHRLAPRYLRASAAEVRRKDTPCPP